MPDSAKLSVRMPEELRAELDVWGKVHNGMTSAEYARAVIEHSLKKRWKASRLISVKAAKKLKTCRRAAPSAKD
jgi:predicted DNA-binding protein